MQLQTVLFFETVEQIYARVFRSVKPGAAIPQISIKFRHYANANSRIELHGAQLRVHISDLLEGAPAPIQEALAHVLISKLFRRLPEPALLARYRRYLNRSDFRRALHLVKRARGRKRFQSPQGAAYDLCVMFEDLNREFFQGLMARPELGWSARPSRSTLGHYDPCHNVIVLSSILDSPFAPKLGVQFVLFHEMLHLKYPTEHRGSRRCVHTPAFKEAERAFPEHAKANLLVKQFVERISSGSGGLGR